MRITEQRGVDTFNGGSGGDTASDQTIALSLNLSTSKLSAESITETMSSIGICGNRRRYGRFFRCNALDGGDGNIFMAVPTMTGSTEETFLWRKWTARSMVDLATTNFSADRVTTPCIGVGTDTLTGGSGNDTLDGGIGADTLTSGAGDDNLYVDDAGDVIVEASGGCRYRLRLYGFQWRIARRW